MSLSVYLFYLCLLSPPSSLFYSPTLPLRIFLYLTLSLFHPPLSRLFSSSSSPPDSPRPIRAADGAGLDRRTKRARFYDDFTVTIIIMPSAMSVSEIRSIPTQGGQLPRAHAATHLACLLGHCSTADARPDTALEVWDGGGNPAAQVGPRRTWPDACTAAAAAAAAAWWREAGV